MIAQANMETPKALTRKHYRIGLSKIRGPNVSPPKQDSPHKSYPQKGTPTFWNPPKGATDSLFVAERGVQPHVRRLAQQSRRHFADCRKLRDSQTCCERILCFTGVLFPLIHKRGLTADWDRFGVTYRP